MAPLALRARWDHNGKIGPPPSWRTLLTLRTIAGLSLWKNSFADDEVLVLETIALRHKDDICVRSSVPVAARGSADAKPSAPTRLRSSIAVSRTSCMGSILGLMRSAALALFSVQDGVRLGDGGRGEQVPADLCGCHGHGDQPRPARPRRCGHEICVHHPP